MRRIQTWLRAIRGVQAAYVQAHGRLPNLLMPRRFTEKMQWRKLFDRNPQFTVFCDKLATREWVAERIGAQFLAPLIWTSGAGEIPVETLISPYFLKSTHASGQIMLVTAEAAQNAGVIKEQAAKWLEICYFERSGEPGYKGVPRRLMAEQILLGPNGGPPEERRMFVFDGKVRVINTVFVEDGTLRNGAFHTSEWAQLDWYFTRRVTRAFPPPRRLADMIRIAEQLGKGIDHLRIDIFDCGDKIFVGEVTPYAWGGLSRFNPDAADLALGRHWRLRWPWLRTIAVLLFTAR